MGAIAGGLVGALVAGGVFVALDDGGGTTTRIIQQSSPTIDRASTNVEGDTLDIASIIARAEPAIVAITTDDGPESGNGGAGTGFVISADGFIVTNNHVVDSADRIEVSFPNGDQHRADVVGSDPSVDLAVLKVDANGLAAVELGNSDQVQVGDRVIAIGNALALEGGLSVTQGILSGLDRTVPEENGAVLVGVIQTDAAINPGNSGGPLLDAQGRVIGINTATANPQFAQNVGFAIPISKALPVIDDLRNGRTPAFLGVATQTVTPAIARELDLSVDHGAYVSEVTGGTPADDAGIERGDVILQIGGVAINGSDDVQSAVRTHRPGDTVQVVVDRDGETHTLQAELTERPDAD
jgi:S1-C subfamily serine protease